MNIRHQFRFKLHAMSDDDETFHRPQNKRINLNIIDCMKE